MTMEDLVESIVGNIQDEYDEEEESYGCQFYFDEDDIARASLYGDRYICPHFQYKDEYRIVRKQI